MQLYVLAYISLTSWRGERELRSLLGEDFVHGPLPYAKGPLGSEADVQSLLQRLREVGRWAPNDDVLAASHPRAPMTAAEAFDRIREHSEHSEWRLFLENIEDDDPELWDVAVAFDEWCISVSISFPGPRIGGASCFVVDRESRRVFPRFMMPLYRHVYEHATVRGKLGSKEFMGS